MQRHIRHIFGGRVCFARWIYPALVVLAFSLVAVIAAEEEIVPPAADELVARFSPTRVVTPVNQVVTPTGIRVELRGLRPQVLALSPDGQILVTAGKTAEIVVVEPMTGRILQKVALPSEEA